MQKRQQKAAAAAQKKEAAEKKKAAAAAKKKEAAEKKKAAAEAKRMKKQAAAAAKNLVMSGRCISVSPCDTPLRGVWMTAYVCLVAQCLKGRVRETSGWVSSYEGGARCCARVEIFI